MELHGVTVRNTRFLRGPNLYAYMPVMQVTLDIGHYEELGSDSFPGFVERLTEWLPGLHKHECSVGRPGGFIERLRRGTYLAHIAEHITLELQSMVGFEVGFGRVRGTGERGVYNVIIAYKEEEPARVAFEMALRLTIAAIHDEPFDMPAELETLMRIAEDHKLGPSTAAIVKAARRKGIPVKRLNPPGNLIQFGYGVYQKRILASETSNTSAIAVEICQQKPLTNQLLETVGVPVPRGRSVTSADEAWRAAQNIGLPVVLKPEAGNQGKGVSLNLNSEIEVRAAYDIASVYDRHVLVESFIEGDDYRLLVVNGKMVAAARRDPAQVVGDGVHSVAWLVEETNKDPRRREGHGSVLTRIKLDNAAQLALSQQNLTLDAIPAAGQTVKLRLNSNLSTGGTSTDVTDEVHPHNVKVAELAAQILAMDVAGVDIVCRDIRRPLDEQHGAIVEVNAAPGLRMHLYPSYGQPRDVGRAIVEMLYPKDAPSRIPIVAVTGTNGKTTVTKLISHIYETAHRKVGATTTEGTYIGKNRIMSGDCAGPRSAGAILLHPHVEVAVLETARGGILREGLAFDWCNVGVVLNISPDHLGQAGINTLEELAKVKQVVIEAVHKEGAAVLNADDPLVAEMSAATDAEVIYFSLSGSESGQNPVVTAHLGNGGRCVLVEDGFIVLAQGQNRTPLVKLNRVGFTFGGAIEFQVKNALAATAAAWAGKLNPALIARALTTFKTDPQTTPGRFNLHEIGGVQVVVDYGHNQAAMAALGQAVQALGSRRTVLVIGLPGDRQDKDLAATIRATLGWADHYVLHDALDRRGREPNVVPELLRKEIETDGRASCEITSNDIEAIGAAWQGLKPGDRLVIVADVVDHLLQSLKRLVGYETDEAACLVSEAATEAPARADAATFEALPPHSRNSRPVQAQAAATYTTV
jgi:cyanophycin synthetase